MNNYEGQKLFYTVPELHKVLGGIVSKAYLYTMIQRGEIVTKRLGGKIVIPATWVDKYIADMTALPDVPTTGTQKGA
ncbi:MAG: helix-turn-helix domain-containing protein [Acidaminococcaceae bacterium]|nr:helix-turn-helix domain-containing protein [Acidaminococcaceae bacterium]MBQ5345186.1 helix-turn-helix domain-containing protein [Acidaminococcaceae bacterium]